MNHLLIIGIDNYLFHGKLNNCVKDVTDFKNLLLEKLDFENENVNEILNENATNSRIQDALGRYASVLKTDDSLLIYFSGHGHYDDALNRGFWVPIDGTTHYSTWIANEVILSILDKISCKHIFILSDSCFSNSMLVPSKSIMEYSKYPSRWALTSSFKAAYDSPKGENGPFAEAVLQFIMDVQNDFRVTELIEDVKSTFAANEYQTPQGSPIKLKGHRGGEWVIKVRSNIDDRDLKGYNGFQKVLKLYKRTSEFKLLQTYEDKTKKIGYQLFQEFDSVFKNAVYFLYLYEGILQNQTYQHLLSNHSYIFKEKKLIILLPKEKNQLNLSIRKKNINNKFKPLNLFYIDEFIRDLCTPKITQSDFSNYLSISNFILPTFAGSFHKDDVKKYVREWFKRSGDPILVIKGAGGIGKTTFAQFIADNVMRESPQTSVFFIDSVQIKDALLKKRTYDNLKIYNFYEAFCDVNDSTQDKLPVELFKINIDAGNILVVIDGLDEVISKIPNFDVDAFLVSIEELSNELCGGKVVITCRTHFWDKTKLIHTEIPMIELQPFNQKQAQEFFEKSFNLDGNKVRKAIKLARDFKYASTSTENVFHPYVLDVIRSIIVAEKDSLEFDLSEFSSKILKGFIKTDYIIFRVCERERLRIGQINVEEQIEFFVYLSTYKRGIISLENFRTDIEAAVGRNINSTSIEALKAHPFLKTTDHTLTFKYDFLIDHFKSIYIANFLEKKDDVKVAEVFLTLVAENCWYGSAVTLDVVHRVTNWDELIILSMSELIDQVALDLSIKQEKRLKCIANLFNLCLSIAHKFKGNDIEINTWLLKNLFCRRKNSIENLCIININSEQNVRFDFSGLEIIRAYIDNFSSFWNCDFDEQTLFRGCQLLNLRQQKANHSVSMKNFVDCSYDKSIESILLKIEEKTVSRTEKARVFVNDFLHLFFSGGKLGRQWEDNVIKPRYSGISQNMFEYSKTIRVFRDKEILLVDLELGRNKFYVNEKYKEDVVKFIKDGTPSRRIVEVIQVFAKS